ncbi:NUDIX hydrolase [Tropicimonas sp. TH_r6]|uniref:NUDIX hydrolase n=1 Tax=Tropicimonas sp. TH_r6 TaxID=3082085 RepID=UPI002955C087|nr:NUDIX hydrolase [Tropicimonas sp. TH_r6]MDV7141541.1 NUDIX hydrolase [Tropicimonas sp. TH_r6]
MAGTIDQLSTRTVHQTRWMHVREDAVRFPDGSEGSFSVVDKNDFAVIVPLHDDGRLQLVRQYRYPVQGRFWEVPQGSWEETPDADPVALARGELEEETGFRAGTLRHIGHYHQAPGYCGQGYDLFLATDLTPGTLNRDHAEQDMETAAFAFPEVLAMIEDGRMMDTTTLAALGLLRLKNFL